MIEGIAFPTASIKDSRIRCDLSANKGELSDITSQDLREIVKHCKVLGVDLRKILHTMRDPIADASQGVPSGLYSTASGGRSEILPLIRKDVPRDLYPVIGVPTDWNAEKQNASDALLDIYEKKTGKKVKHMLLWKLKGRGPGPGRRVAIDEDHEIAVTRERVMSSEHFAQQHSLPGFSGHSIEDVDFRRLMEQNSIFVQAIDGSWVIHQYQSGRRLEKAIPVVEIEAGDQIVAQPRTWNEPLYLEFYAEKAHNIRDLVDAMKRGRITPAQMLGYIELVCEEYGFVADATESEGIRRKKLTAFVLDMMWKDAQAEIRVYGSDDNRSDQNFAVLKNQDFSGNTLIINNSFLQQFMLNVSHYASLGQMDFAALVPYAQKVMNAWRGSPADMRSFFYYVQQMCRDIPEYARDGAFELLEKLTDVSVQHDGADAMILKDIVWVAGTLGGEKAEEIISRVERLGVLSRSDLFYQVFCGISQSSIEQMNSDQQHLLNVCLCSCSESELSPALNHVVYSAMKCDPEVRFSVIELLYEKIQQVGLRKELTKKMLDLMQVVDFQNAVYPVLSMFLYNPDRVYGPEQWRSFIVAAGTIRNVAERIDIYDRVLTHPQFA